MSGQSGAGWQPTDPFTFTSGPPIVALENIRVFPHRCARCQRLVEVVVAVGSAFGVGLCQQCFEQDYGPDDQFAREPVEE